MASVFGCSITKLHKHLTKDELPIWLAYYGNKIGYTFDHNKIDKQRTEAFLAKARSNNWGM